MRGGPANAGGAAAALPTEGGRLARWVERRRGRKTGDYSLLLRDSVLYGGGRVLQKFLSAMLLPLYTSFLSPSDYGVLGMVLVTSTLIDVVVVLGFDIAFTRFYFDDKSRRHRNEVITTEFWVATIYPAVLLGGLALLMPQILSVLMHQHGYAIYFDVALINVFFTNMAATPFTLFRLEHRPYTFVAFNLARILIQIPLTIVLVVAFHMGVMGVLIGNAVTSFILNAAATPTYWRYLTWRVHWTLTKAMTAFAAPAVFSGLAMFILNLSDRFFVMRYWGKTQVGLYTTAFIISQPVYMVMTAFRMAWPQWHFSRLNNPQEHKLLVARSSTYFLLVCMLMLVAQGIWMPLMLRVLTFHNSAFWSAGPTAVVLTAATVIYAAYFVFWIGTNVAKKNRLIPLITGIGSGLNVGLNILLIPHFGIIAAAWTTFAGYAVLAALVYPLSRHYYAIPYEWPRLIKMSVAAAVGLAIGWGIGRLTGESVYMPFGQLLLRELAKLPALAAFFIMLRLTQFFTPREAQAMRAFSARVLARLTGRRAPESAAASASVGRSPVQSAILSQEVEDAEEDELELETQAHLDISESPSPT